MADQASQEIMMFKVVDNIMDPQSDQDNIDDQNVLEYGCIEAKISALE